MDKEIQQHLAKLGDHRTVKAALFRFGPEPDADEYHFRRSARSEELWAPVTKLSARFVAQGRSEPPVQELVEAYGQRFLLLATATGRPEAAPYIVTIAAADGADAETLLASMRDAADDCIDETHTTYSLSPPGRGWGEGVASRALSVAAAPSPCPLPGGEREKKGNPMAERMAVVTGAGSGIGRACAQMLAARGAGVAVVDLDEARARETAGLIEKAGGRARAFAADTSKAVELDRAVDGAIAALGPLEVMVNNAGILDGYFDVHEMSEATWRRVLDIDLTGVFLGCKRALGEMLPRGRGRIVNMASVAGLNGTGGGAAYIAAKHGVVGLTRQMAVVYSARGITVNAVCPGPILTGLRQHSQEILGPDIPDMSGRGVAVNDDQIRGLVPIGRRGTAEDIAAAVCFLASDEAGYITGHTLVVDGGWRAK